MVYAYEVPRVTCHFSLLKFCIDKGAYTRAMVEDSSDKIEELVKSISQLKISE